eukprot:GHVO01002769.1.p2 GENE.GHVO01002769.1~~GHVO01002769.1.p2  ORF type:complete len:125 (+),score=8.86 GHVO01002769.1:112-486(+)
MTSDKDNAGTDAQVTLTVFGVHGDSGALPLGEPGGGFFEAAATDQFDIWLEPEEVGKVRKIRIEHDNLHEGCGWHLNKVPCFIGVCTLFILRDCRLCLRINSLEPLWSFRSIDGWMKMRMTEIS